MADADAVVVGSGPNGLAAAITLASAGLSVTVLEAAALPGGGVRSAESSIPGFLHDLCSSVYPLGAASPFFKSLPLEHYGCKWLHAPLALAHPLDDGSAAVLSSSIGESAAALEDDAGSYQELAEQMHRLFPTILEDLLAPVTRLPKAPLAMLRFGVLGGLPAERTVVRRFRGSKAQALFGGLAAHSGLPLSHYGTTAFALLFVAMAHRDGWPIVEGGAGRLTSALCAYLESLGGKIVCDQRITDLSQVPPARLVLLDISAEQFGVLARDKLSDSYRSALARFRRGPGVFKVDYALDGPIPFRAAECRRAGTVHLGGSFQEIAAAEARVMKGEVPENPFIIVTQPSLFDRSRAPSSQHTAWAYCHVPNGSESDALPLIERQLERFAPGFSRLVLARKVTTPAGFEEYNLNYHGGDINGGAQDLLQLLFRPRLQRTPYATPLEGVYLCSASTPPGGGVHGMCGYHAARTALARL